MLSKSKKYICIVDATYALMLYMLYATDDMLQNTTYFVGATCGACNLPNKIIMPPIQPFTNKELLKYRLKCLKYRRQLKHSQIYAQDHIYFAAPLIDNLPYIVLEDCPNFFVIREERKEIKFKPTFRSLWYNLKVGRIYQRYAGHNPWCKKRIITSEQDKELFENSNLSYEQVSLRNLWDSASDYKKRYIQEVLSIPQIDLLQKDVVIFSQPLTDDANLTDEELTNIFRPYVEEYGAKHILVKLHPRDHFDYKKAFPGITILSTKAPQQLLDIMGMKIQTAITVCSSAVSSMNKNCNVIWIGAEIDERIVRAYGHIKNPQYTK